jgi:hypothetical protein
MRKLFTLVLVAIILQSCAIGKTVPLKGNYENPNIFYFDKSLNEVWGGLMKVIVQKGLSVSSFEKESGVIFGNEIIFFSKTYEDEKGNLVDKNAYMVSEKFEDGEFTIIPTFVKAKISFLIYPEKTKTALYINIFNEIGERINNNQKVFAPAIYRAESTGNFEKMIADSIKF